MLHLLYLLHTENSKLKMILVMQLNLPLLSWNWILPFPFDPPKGTIEKLNRMQIWNIIQMNSKPNERIKLFEYFKSKLQWIDEQ